MDITLTCDFTAEQLRYIARLVGRDVAQLTDIVRSPAFDHYGPVESERIHHDIRIGAGILGALPRLPRRETA
jgi:hypothetical protein